MTTLTDLHPTILAAYRESAIATNYRESRDLHHHANP
jgi:hypothetical protein